MEVKVLAVFLMVTQMSSTSTTRVCRPEPVDIVFVLDESGSVGRVHFGLQLNFIADFVDSFTIGRHAAQIALVTFSTNPVAEFHLNAFSDKDNLKKQIHNVTYSHPGLTRTATALEYVRNNCVRSENGYRINASHIIIVMTDGRSMDSNKTINEARILQSMGFSMFAIGISSSVDPTEINKIASDINKTAIVSTFTDLGSIRNQIVTSTCEDIAKLTQTTATSKERITTNKPSQRTTTSRRTHTVTNANTMLSKITKATTLHTHLKTTKARTVPTMTTKTTSLPTKITKASTLPTKATKATNLLFKITKATTLPTKTTKSTTLTTKVTQTSMLPTKITKGTTLPTKNTKTTNTQAKTTAPNLPTKTTTTTTLPTKTTTTTTLPTKMTTALPTKTTTTTTLPTKTTTTTTLPTKTTTTTTLPTKIINGSPSHKPVHSVSNNGHINSQGSPSTVVHGHATNQNSSAVSLVTAIPSLATNPGHSISTTQVTRNVLQNNTNSGSGHFINHITNNNSNNPQNNVVTISQTTSKPNTHLNFNLVNSSNLNSAPTGATLPSTHPNFMVNILTTKRSTMYSHFTVLSHTNVNNNSKNGSGMTNTSSVFSSKNNSTSTNNAGSGSAGHVTSNVHSNNTSIVNTLIGYVPSGTSTNNVSNIANNSSKTGSGSTVVIAPSAHSRTTAIHNTAVFSNTSTGSGFSMSTNSSSLLNTSTVYNAKPGSGPAVPVNSNNAVHNNVVQGHASLTAIPSVYVNRPGQTNVKPASASVVSGNYPAVNKWGTRTVTGSASAITTPVNSNNVITKSLTTPRGPPNIHQKPGSMIYHGASSANNIGTTRPTRNYFGNSNSFSNNKTPPYGSNTGTTNTGKSGNGANQIPVGSVQSHNAFNPVSVLSGVNHQSGTGNIGNNNTSRDLPGNRGKGYSNEKTAHFPHWFEYLEISIVSVISLVALGFLGCCINILCLMCCRKNKRSKAEKGSWKFGRLLPMSKPKERLFD